MKNIILLLSHGGMLAIGFVLGIYALPILTAPNSPSDVQVQEMAGAVQYTAEFKKDIKGSDFLHWGEGKVSVSPTAITFKGELAPGPDYKLYLLKEPVETAEEFLKVKSQAIQLGDVKTFDSFIVENKDGVNINDYKGVLVWCESFGAFITAASYQ